MAVVALGLVGVLLLVRGCDRRPAADPAAPLGVAGPVLLVPGHGGDRESLVPLQRTLAAAGRAAEIVDIGDGSGDIDAYGRAVADRARALVAGGAPSVDLVGYSEGGLIARAAVRADPRLVRRVVTVASPHDGTAVATLGVRINSPACDTACRQLAEGSDFLAGLPRTTDPGRTAALYSQTDDVIRPAESAALPGATLVDLSALCPGVAWDHGSIIRSPATLAVATGFLDSGRVPAACPG